MTQKIVLLVALFAVGPCFIGCGPGNTPSVPEAGTPAPAGGADLDAEKLEAMERARQASEGDVE